ncbi:hypothetical protein CEXT_496651 [Caerostris extrusa]|uniref:Uncharacterized protein n=1 Tax=Caerostris extrusa TaxID=172846 RepID=A0AAV4R801_CAEEX|nr:hypothetical protein CEXT_496651 [Caerostris extrusa]
MAPSGISVADSGRKEQRSTLFKVPPIQLLLLLRKRTFLPPLCKSNFKRTPLPISILKLKLKIPSHPSLQ